MRQETTLYKRLGILSTGYSVNFLITWLFDDWLYPIVMSEYGAVSGGAIMTCLSLVICLLTIIYYDRTKTDWLGIEAYKEMGSGESSVGRWTRFTLLSLVTDPFIVTAYMRRGANRYDGLTSYDWKVFLSSLVISNVSWSLVTLTSLRVVEGDIEAVVLILTAVSIILPLTPKAAAALWRAAKRAAS